MLGRFIILSLLILIPSMSQAGNVFLAWDHSTSPGVVAYRVYFGTASRSYTFQQWIGRQTIISVEGLPNGTWFFAVVAIDLNGNVSGFSNEVSTPVSGDAPPFPLIPKKVSRLRFGAVQNVSRETLYPGIELQLVGKSPSGPKPPGF